jgi:hypothetical protein
MFAKPIAYLSGAPFRLKRGKGGREKKKREKQRGTMYLYVIPR